jgi:hypothetical protein
MDSDSGTVRQRPLRLDQFLPITVRGVDAGGKAFEAHTVLETISTGDLTVRLQQRVEPGTRLFAVVRFFESSEEALSGARVAMRGVVVRTEPFPGEGWAITMTFTHHRFLWRPDRGTWQEGNTEGRG